MQNELNKELRGTPLGHKPSNDSFAPLDLNILNGNKTQPPTLPLDAFNKWSEWISLVAEKSSAPEDYVAIGLLATASTLLGNSRWISPWDGWKEPPILWLAAVGNPSSGKSPALDSSLNFLRKLEEGMTDDFEKHHCEYERDKEVAALIKANWQRELKAAINEGQYAPTKPSGAIEPEQPARPRLYLSDATPEALGHILSASPKGALFQRDELSGWFGNFDKYGGNGGERAFWIEAFGGRSYVIDRVRYNNKPLRIPHLSLSILGGIQPEKLASLLLKGVDDGLAARFLFAWPEPKPARRPSDQIIDPAFENAIRALHKLQMALDENDTPIPVIKMLNADASNEFETWWRTMREAENEVFGYLLSHWGKLPGIALRLALVLEYLDWSLSNQPEMVTISQASVSRSIRLVEDYFKPMARRVYGNSSLPAAGKNAAIIARQIMKFKPDIVNASRIRREWNLPGLNEADPIHKALDVLVEGGWLSKPTKPIGKGRPRLDYKVNPELYHPHSN